MKFAAHISALKNLKNGIGEYMTFFNNKLETMPRKELKLLQFERLQSTLNRVYHNVEYYKNSFNKINFLPENFKSIDDLKRLPFTTKDDLREAFPYKMFAVPLRDIVRIHSTTGTTGAPIVVGYTKNDLKHWSELNARSFSALGVNENDLIQIAFHYGLTTGGLGLHLGAEKIGASVVPASTGQTQKQIEIMLNYKTTVLACSPSYAVFIAETMLKMDIPPSGLNLRIGIFGSEPWSERIREYLEKKLNIKAYDIYGLTEIIGPGVSFECLEKAGLHINEDHFIVELINPKTLEPITGNQAGELVFTTITKEGFPLIRYRTGDVAFINADMCACGRTHSRMSRVVGRTDDMFFVEGVKIFPPQIERILQEEKGLLPHFQIFIKRDAGEFDRIEVMVEINENIFNDDLAAIDRLREKLESKLRAELNIRCEINFVSPNTIERTDGKTRRVIDMRNL